MRENEKTQVKQVKDTLWTTGGGRRENVGSAGSALRRVRTQRELVARLGEQLRRETMDGVRSARLDGLPAGHGMPSGLDARLIKRETLERLAARESALLREYEQAARLLMDEMNPEDYAFCALYYLAGLSLGETAEALERSERQCLRYKRRIEEGGKCHQMSACQQKEAVVR